MPVNFLEYLPLSFPPVPKHLVNLVGLCSELFALPLTLSLPEQGSGSPSSHLSLPAGPKRLISDTLCLCPWAPLRWGVVRWYSGACHEIKRNGYVSSNRSVLERVCSGIKWEYNTAQVFSFFFFLFRLLIASLRNRPCDLRSCLIFPCPFSGFFVFIDGGGGHGYRFHGD